MRQVGFVDNVTAGVERVKQSTSSSEGFAFIAEATQVNVSISIPLPLLTNGPFRLSTPF